MAAYWSKIATPLYLAPPLGYLHDPWRRKNRIMGISDGESILMISLAVLIQYTCVTDGQRNGQMELAWHVRAIACMLSRVKTNITRAMLCY